MSLYLGNNLVSGVATPTEPTRNLGQIIESIVPLTDAGLHLLDGALIDGYGIYSKFVEYIASIYDASASYFCTEADWQTSVTTYGVCGKFVYNSTNNTVRLPKITGKLDGTTDVTALGNLANQFVKLPNIMGELSSISPLSQSSTGAFSNINAGGLKIPGGSSDGVARHYFNASNVSPVYSGNGTDTKIHEQAINVLYYIVIATSTKTDIQVDIDEVATDLNSKADVDLSNMSASQSVKNEIVSWGMPDYSAGISLSWETDYTAQFDCYIYIAAKAQTSAYLIINDVSFNFNGNAYPVGIFVPITKSSTFKASGGNTPREIIQYPLKGAN